MKHSIFRLRNIARFALCLVMSTLALQPIATAQSLDMVRSDMRRVVEIVVADLQKNYYDPSFKGMDIKRLADETKQQINSMTDAGQMCAAVWEFTQKLDDTHTRFIPPRFTTTPKFGFRARGFGDKVYVVSLTKNGPASKAGLKPGDRVLALNGKEVTRDNIRDVLFYYSRLRPVRGLVVDYERDGAADRLMIEPEVRREAMVKRYDDISDVYRDIVEEQNDYAETPFMYGNVDDFGYVKLREFFGTAPEGVMYKIKDAHGVIVDLRGNLGGSIETLKQFAGYFDRDATLMADDIGRKKTEKMFSKPQHLHFDGPVVVLVDSESGSASEILAYHLQRTKRAVIVGDQTMGSVATSKFYFESVNNGSVDFGISATVGKVVFPDGKSLDKIGVTPDVKCIPTQADLAGGKDPCLRQAAAVLKEKLGKAPGATAGAGQ